jgi:hypothetical protein
MSDLGGDGAMSGPELAKVVKMLAQRWFLMRDVHSAVGTMLLQPRWAMSVMRGPMTRGEIRRALGSGGGEPQQ